MPDARQLVEPKESLSLEALLNGAILPEVEVFPHVYPPQTDTFLLLAHVQPSPGDSVLELGAGCGIIAVHLARHAREVIAVDINPHAVENTKRNAARHHRHNLTVYQGDLYAPVQGRRFDLIVANPPYVPTPPDWQPTDIIETAWNAGADGRKLIDRMLEGLPEHLTSTGRLVLVQSGLADIPRTQKQLRALGLQTRIVASQWLKLGPVSRGRYKWLKQLPTFIHPEAELLVVIKASYEIR